MFYSKIGKVCFVTLTIIIIISIMIGLEYGIKYYYNPIKKEVHFTTTGCLIYDFTQADYEVVDVEVMGENLNYLFKNNNDAIQGDILIKGKSIFGRDKSYDSYDNKYYGSFYSFFGNSSKSITAVSISNDKSLCNIIALSKSWDIIVCGVVADSSISDKIAVDMKKEALLVIPANSLTTSQELIKELSLHSLQMKEWLIEHGWIDDQ